MLRAKEQIQNRLYIYSCIADTPGGTTCRACPERVQALLGRLLRRRREGPVRPHSLGCTLIIGRGSVEFCCHIISQPPTPFINHFWIIVNQKWNFPAGSGNDDPMVRPAGEKQRGCGLWMHAAYGIIAGTAEGRTGRHDTERICHTSADAAHHAWEVRTGRQYARFGVYH